MAGLFKKAAAKAQEGAETAKKAKGLVWNVGDGAEAAILNEAIGQLNKLHGEAKAIEAKMDVYKGPLKKYAFQNYVREYAARGVPPDAPLSLVNSDGQKVGYIIQDRTASTKVSDAQVEQLQELMGEDAANEMVLEQVSFGLDPAVLALPHVAEVVEKKLEEVVEELQRRGVPGAENLVTAESRKAFKPGLLSQLGVYCGKDAVKIKEVIEVMGSAATRYIRC